TAREVQSLDQRVRSVESALEQVSRDRDAMASKLAELERSGRAPVAVREVRRLTIPHSTPPRLRPPTGSGERAAPAAPDLAPLPPMPVPGPSPAPARAPEAASTLPQLNHPA